MSRVHFFKLKDSQRTWAMSICPMNENTEDSGYFRSMAAISFSRILQDTYHLDSTIKKIMGWSRAANSEPMFRVIVRFDNDEDEGLFIIKASDGLEV